jgi:hypothetical protein
MLNAASLTPAVLDRILAFLAALFLPSTAGNLDAARDAAGALLASYDVRTDRQLRLAALAIAFSFGALDSLSRAAAPDLPVNQVLRLRGNANALNRAAQQNEAKLDKSIGQPEAALPGEPRDLPASSDTQDLVSFLRATPSPADLSRQQRRFAERQAEKQRQRQQQAARLDERVAKRLAEKEAARLAAVPLSAAPVPMHQPEAA